MKRQTRKRVIDAVIESQTQDSAQPQTVESEHTSELAPDSQAICGNTPQNIAADSPVSQVMTVLPRQAGFIDSPESISSLPQQGNSELTAGYQQDTGKTGESGISEQSLQQKDIYKERPWLWKPGESGNPGGRPKKKPITEAYERLMSKPEFMQLVEQSVLAQLKKGSMVSAFQLKEMTDRVEGRVTEKVELGGELALGIAERMLRARNRNTG